MSGTHIWTFYSMATEIFVSFLEFHLPRFDFKTILCKKMSSKSCYFVEKSLSFLPSIKNFAKLGKVRYVNKEWGVAKRYSQTYLATFAQIDSSTESFVMQFD